MAQAALRTIGYEGRAIDEFLTTIERSGVDLLIDIRDVPISRKKGFSKNKLAELLRDAGVEYLHLKGLGDPKPGRIAAREGNIDEFRRIYNAHLQSEVAQNDLLKAIQAAMGRAACLLCYERDPKDCHRRIVGEEMARRAGFQLIHIDVNHPGDMGHANGSRAEPSNRKRRAN